MTIGPGLIPPSYLRIVALAGGGFGLLLTPVVMATWLAESDAYLLAGRLFFPAYLGAMAGLYCFQERIGRWSTLRVQGRNGRWSALWVQGAFWLTMAALGVALVGDLGSYYAGSGNGASVGFSPLQSIFYGAVEFPAVVTAQVGMTAYGLGLRRSGAVGARTAWAVAAVGPLGLLLWPLHIPSGPMFAFNLFTVISSLAPAGGGTGATARSGAPVP